MASWADPLSRVEINFYFHGAFRRMMLSPSMLLISEASKLSSSSRYLLSAASSLERLPTYIALKPDPGPGSQRQVSKAKRAARTPLALQTGGFLKSTLGK